ncbi:MAG: hypothetical protein RCO49_04295 [Rickettsia endosymbiont of Argas persicus]
MKEYYYSKEALVQYLIDNIPEFKEYWESEKKWRNTNRTYHTEIKCLLRFVDDEIEHDNIRHLPFIFNLIEELVECGNEDAENAAWTMFLEDIPEKPCG